MITLTTKSADDTRALAGQLALAVRGGDVILLAGDLGAGKTTFAQGFGAGLGVDESITSPTFALVREYQGRLRLLHADMYRLDHLQEVIDLGLHELVDESAVALVEWGDVAAPVLPARHLLVRISFRDTDESRTLRLEPVGNGWPERELVRLLERWQ